MQPAVYRLNSVFHTWCTPCIHYTTLRSTRLLEKGVSVPGVSATLVHHLDEALGRDPRVVAASERAKVRVRLAHQPALKQQDATVRGAHVLNTVYIKLEIAHSTLT